MHICDILPDAAHANTRNRRPARDRHGSSRSGASSARARLLRHPRLAQHLSQQGLRVGLITNDQGRNLVDTTLLRWQGFATEGDSRRLLLLPVQLTGRGGATTAPAEPAAGQEPVGSCTDLVATVTYPLRRLYGENFTVAPVSVLVDPVPALRVLAWSPAAASPRKCSISTSSSSRRPT